MRALKKRKKIWLKDKENSTSSINLSELREMKHKLSFSQDCDWFRAVKLSKKTSSKKSWSATSWTEKNWAYSCYCSSSCTSDKKSRAGERACILRAKKPWSCKANSRSIRKRLWKKTLLLSWLSAKRSCSYYASNRKSRDKCACSSHKRSKV